MFQKASGRLAALVQRISTSNTSLDGRHSSGTGPTESGSIRTEHATLVVTESSFPGSTYNRDSVKSNSFDAGRGSSTAASRPVSSHKGSVRSRGGSVRSPGGSVRSANDWADSAAGSVPSARGTIPSDAGSVPSTRGSVPSTRGSMPSPRRSMPSAAGSVLSTIPTVPSAAGSGMEGILQLANRTIPGGGSASVAVLAVSQPSKSSLSWGEQTGSRGSYGGWSSGSHASAQEAPAALETAASNALGRVSTSTTASAQLEEPALLLHTAGATSTAQAAATPHSISVLASSLNNSQVSGSKSRSTRSLFPRSQGSGAASSRSIRSIEAEDEPASPLATAAGNVLVPALPLVHTDISSSHAPSQASDSSTSSHELQPIECDVPGVPTKQAPVAPTQLSPHILTPVVNVQGEWQRPPISVSSPTLSQTSHGSSMPSLQQQPLAWGEPSTPTQHMQPDSLLQPVTVSTAALPEPDSRTTTTKADGIISRAAAPGLMELLSKELCGSGGSSPAAAPGTPDARTVVMGGAFSTIEVQNVAQAHDAVDGSEVGSATDGLLPPSSAVLDEVGQWMAASDAMFTATENGMLPRSLSQPTSSASASSASSPKPLAVSIPPTMTGGSMRRTHQTHTYTSLLGKIFALLHQGEEPQPLPQTPPPSISLDSSHQAGTEAPLPDTSSTMRKLSLSGAENQPDALQLQQTGSAALLRLLSGYTQWSEEDARRAEMLAVAAEPLGLSQACTVPGHNGAGAAAPGCVPVAGTDEQTSSKDAGVQTDDMDVRQALESSTMQDPATMALGSRPDDASVMGARVARVSVGVQHEALPHDLATLPASSGSESSSAGGADGSSSLLAQLGILALRTASSMRRRAVREVEEVVQALVASRRRSTSSASDVEQETCEEKGSEASATVGMAAPPITSDAVQVQARDVEASWMEGLLAQLGPAPHAEVQGPVNVSQPDVDSSQSMLHIESHRTLHQGPTDATVSAASPKAALQANVFSPARRPRPSTPAGSPFVARLLQVLEAQLPPRRGSSPTALPYASPGLERTVSAKDRGRPAAPQPIREAAAGDSNRPAVPGRVQSCRPEAQEQLPAAGEGSTSPVGQQELRTLEAQTPAGQSPGAPVFVTHRVPHRYPTSATSDPPALEQGCASYRTRPSTVVTDLGAHALHAQHAWASAERDRYPSACVQPSSSTLQSDARDTTTPQPRPDSAGGVSHDDAAAIQETQASGGDRPDMGAVADSWISVELAMELSQLPPAEVQRTVWSRLQAARDAQGAGAAKAAALLLGPNSGWHAILKHRLTHQEAVDLKQLTQLIKSRKVLTPNERNSVWYHIEWLLALRLAQHECSTGVPGQVMVPGAPGSNAASPNKAGAPAAQWSYNLFTNISPPQRAIRAVYYPLAEQPDTEGRTPDATMFEVHRALAPNSTTALFMDKQWAELRAQALAAVHSREQDARNRCDTVQWLNSRRH